MRRCKRFNVFCRDLWVGGISKLLQPPSTLFAFKINKCTPKYVFNAVFTRPTLRFENPTNKSRYYNINCHVMPKFIVYHFSYLFIVIRDHKRWLWLPPCETSECFNKGHVLILDEYLQWHERVGTLDLGKGGGSVALSTIRPDFVVETLSDCR